ncbi:PREDICTED: RING-H2 finger protein ATL38-like [Ipomoea nil]|uniref:RING-H2 finger protein ATL38-like n=1 Tax=Ipomoea nil TaxID=35883 RepID=UPI00090129FA|nr:PREDICTED: RING-H2 finger protein ATL38-like [Ipomoea nil]
MISSETNLVMTVIGFAVSTMFIVFVCTRLICARIQLSSTRRSLARGSGSDLSILERGLHGLEPLAVSKFPTKKYSDVFFTSAEDTQCTVCLGDYQQEDSLRILPFCGHYFHATCIDVWLQQHSTCPVCRISLREVTEKKRFMMPPLFSSAVRCHHAMASVNVNPHQCIRSWNRLSSTPPDRSGSNIASDNCHPPSSGRTVAAAAECDSVSVQATTPVAKGSTNKQTESPSNI